MAVIKCKMCGGTLAVIPESTVAECEYCGSVQTVPQQDDEKKLTLFARANRLRFACEFDKAAGVYESIVAEFPEEAESYWGLVLCKYGIEYVDDPATGKKVPTCHRSSFESIMEDSDFEQALENTDAVARKIYREEAKQIEQIRKGIIAVSANEQPYDIFICYKETDENGERTLDSVLAQDIYDALTQKGYRTFFARISLEDKLGVEYEPFIFAALNSAKIMLAVGTDYEYYNAVWVKNEWSRFLKLMAKDKTKHLIPCYKGIDAYDMPKEFARLQAQDLGKIGAMQDLLRGIEKIMPKADKEAATEQTAPLPQAEDNRTAAPLLERAFMFLEDGEWENADKYCERVLDMDPKNAVAYAGKLLAELKCGCLDDLGKRRRPFEEKNSYLKAFRFGDSGLKEKLQCMAEQARNNYEEDQARLAAEKARIRAEEARIRAEQERQAQIERERKEQERIKQIYEKAKKILDTPIRSKEATMIERLYGVKSENSDVICEAELQKAADMLASISGYEDARQLRDQCLERIEQRRKAEVYRTACNKSALVHRKSLQEACELFETIRDYKDAGEKLAQCHEKLKAMDRQEQDRQQEERRKRYRQQGLCQHCGGELKGLFKKECTACGKPKDY